MLRQCAARSNCCQKFDKVHKMKRKGGAPWETILELYGYARLWEICHISASPLASSEFPSRRAGQHSSKTSQDLAIVARP
jgi:hypothetical protein